MVGMTELLDALRQLDVENNDIVSVQIKSAYETGAFRSGLLHRNEKPLSLKPQRARKQMPLAAPKNKISSTAPIKSKGPFEAKPATRSTTKLITARQKLSTVTNKT